MQYGVVYKHMWHRKECETSKKSNQNYNNMLSFITLSYVIWTHGNIALKLDQVFEACKCHI